MELKNFEYNLPPDLIAQQPAKPRDHSRLFVYDRQLDQITHDYFYQLPSYLNPGDVLVLNNTKVFPARLIGYKDSGGKIEIFLLKKINTTNWQVLVGKKRKHLGTKVNFNKKFFGILTKNNQDGTWEIKFNLSGNNFWQQVNKIGQTPLPPYIKKLSNRKDYQTIYANKNGSVAAPTAGLHFTKQLINQLKKQKIQIEYITLHVGLGTFAPVKTNDITKHQLHSEWVEVEKETAKRLNQAKKAGKKIVAVGTTSVRTLEALAIKQKNGYVIKSTKKWINIFIYPGYKFKFVDLIITNFHLPQSTLLMLVATFLAQNKSKKWGIKKIKQLYQIAVHKKYRFYSFGDGMLIK